MSNTQKSGVVFIDNSGECRDVLTQLSKSALRASGKVVRKILRENIPKRTGRFKNHIGTWAFIDRQTGQPTLQVGFYGWQQVKKHHKEPSHLSPWWVEFGTQPHEVKVKSAKVMAYDDNVYGKKVMLKGRPAQHILRNAVFDNIDKIRAVQVEYLKEMNKTLEQAGAKCYFGEDVDEHE